MQTSQKQILHSRSLSLADIVQVEVVNQHNRQHFPQTCQKWIEQPAIMYSGMGMDSTNAFHHFFDSLNHIFHTAADLGYFNMTSMTER